MYSTVFQVVLAGRFSRRIANLKRVNPRMGENLWKYDISEYRNMRLFMTSDGSSGFALKETLAGYDLVNVFNTGIKGMGHILVSAAIEQGATTLDCLDGFLPTFYAKFGFEEYNREPNWTAGEPDVIFMKHQGNLGTMTLSVNRYAGIAS